MNSSRLDFGTRVCQKFCGANDRRNVSVRLLLNAMLVFGVINRVQGKSGMSHGPVCAHLGRYWRLTSNTGEFQADRLSTMSADFLW